MRWISQSSDWLAEGNSESDPLYQHQKVDQQRPRRGLLLLPRNTKSRSVNETTATPPKSLG
jgi:hypothetical protein